VKIPYLVLVNKKNIRFLAIRPNFQSSLKCFCHYFHNNFEPFSKHEH
jgi:hypothetical protein